ncbi:hypothetical protein IAT38_001250 [Cryptococcus sp. DSM 104549]
MFHVDSSSASSPFSTRSTISSSPEALNGGGDPANGHGQPGRLSAHGHANGHAGYPVQGMVQALMGSVNGSMSGPSAQLHLSPPHPPLPVQPSPGPNAHPSFPPTPQFRLPSPASGPSAAPAPAPVAGPSRLPEHLASSASKSSAAASVASGGRASASAHSSQGGHGGARAEPPKRMHEVDGLAVVAPALDELAAGADGRNLLLLQGDPLYSDKSRVETAIRVIIDILRFAPLSPNSPTPSPPPSLLPIIPHSPTGDLLMTLERISTFNGLRLQAGTTTKNSSKKQLQAIGHIPKEQLAYLETAVYMSGEGGKRVYVCRRCRNREARRRDQKDRNRKRAPNAHAHVHTSDSDASSPAQRQPRRSLVPPSQDFITAENPEDYDPRRNGQVVEEPPWDPDCSDWRHEIVLFNTPSEVKLGDGSCNWLPFRVVCYGKCHGEKVGFQIKFTLRTWDGRIIASATTKPIRITDDHKTDTKSKVKVDGMTSNTPSHAPSTSIPPPIPRARKSRASASAASVSASVASSRGQSPAPSESESVHSVQSVQSLSEAGAVMQKQTPSVRAGKPYERPERGGSVGGGGVGGGFAPSLATIHQQADGVQHPYQAQQPLQHQQQPQQQLQHQPPQQHQPQQQQHQPGDINMSQFVHTVSPHQLRGPQFQGGMGPGSGGLGGGSGFVNGGGSGHRSGAPSVASSSGASPTSQFLNLGGHGGHASHGDTLFGSPMQFSSGMVQQPPLGYDALDREMSSLLNGRGMEDLFVGSSRGSISSLDDQGSVFSASFADDRSSAMFSQSGLPPTTEDTDMEQYLDYPSGERASAASPMTGLSGLSHPSGFHSDGLAALGSPPSGSNFPGLPFDEPLGLAAGAPLSPAEQATQNAQLSSLLAQANAQAQANAPPQPMITHVIPGDGPMAGGTTIAIAGSAFQPGMVVVFGQRPASTEFVSPGFMQCRLPPSAFAGVVEVTVQGAARDPGTGPMLFTYTDMDKDAMKLALAIQSQYQGSSSDAAYRLAHHVTRSASGSQWSGPSNSASPMSGPSPGDAAALTAADAADEPDDADDRSDSVDSKSSGESSDLQSTIISFLASLDENAPGSLRASGAINHTNAAQQTLLHIATVMGFSRLVRRLIVGGAHIDVQDANGYTPLAFAALCGRHTCARVLIEAGASYDRPTAYGEMPLDLAKFGEHVKVEKLLLSAVWSTMTEAKDVEEESRLGSPRASVATSLAGSIDDDNPSSGSEVDEELGKVKIQTRRGKSGKGKRAMSIKSERHRRGSQPAPAAAPLAPADDTTPDDPPPYAPPAEIARPHADEVLPHDDHSTWMKYLASLQQHRPAFLPGAVWDHLPTRYSFFGLDKHSEHAASSEQAQVETQPHGWVAFPTPSWETLQKMTSPEEMKLFTQAMAAAALNAVVQTGVTTSNIPGSSTQEERGHSRRASRYALATEEDEQGQKNGAGRGRRRRKSANAGSETGVMVERGGRKRSSSASSGDKVVKQVKRDRMLYLFWLPILLFVGFWLLVSALPIATGFALIYARKITRAIKQRM